MPYGTMTVKESFNVAGLPTTFGNPLWKDNIAAENAFLIDRLLQAGAVVFGKTNVPFMPGELPFIGDQVVCFKPRPPGTGVEVSEGTGRSRFAAAGRIGFFRAPA
jgi:hypothetical protein